VGDTVTMNGKLLHLLPLSEYQAARAQPIRPDTLDREGFTHCSPDVPTALAVANTLFQESTEQLVAIELDPEKLSAPVRWEKPSPRPPEGVSPDVLMPHVYGPLDPEAVLDIRYARRDTRGRYIALETRSQTAEEYDLLPHPEGGWYRRTWTSPRSVETPNGPRPTATAIYFLLPPGQTSAWHVVSSAELWLWHRGGPLTLSLAGTGEEPADDPQQVVLGVGAGQSPQALVPAGTWQRATASATVETLVSCVVSPGFDFADFRAL
jgi:predicted cupin superfamily sugar epimerase/uncharacterized protein (DUF952 family)